MFFTSRNFECGLLCMVQPKNIFKTRRFFPAQIVVVRAVFVGIMGILP